MAALKTFTFKQPPPPDAVWSPAVADGMVGQEFDLRAQGVLPGSTDGGQVPPLVMNLPVGRMRITKVVLDADGALLITALSDSKEKENG